MGDPLIILAALVGIVLVALLVFGYARKGAATRDLEDEVRDWRIDAHSRW
jgi:hypothetical protein